MATAPTVPREQHSCADNGAASIEDAGLADRRDLKTGVQSPQPGDADVNLKQEGRFGNLNQNLTAIRNVQDR
jgi:hypothetical protein